MFGRLRARRPDPGSEPDAELRRAARVLTIRSRRAAGGLMSGRYQAAFRGSGMEFEESRPYVPGDDPRRMDWNAMARSGEPFVKRFREERGRTVLIALDVSASMAFASQARSKAEHGAHLAALLAAAAGQAGDRVGFVAFDDEVRCVLPPGRRAAHAWRIVESAALHARSAGGGTNWPGALDALRSEAGSRAVLFVVSDFRPMPGTMDAEIEGGLTELGDRHELVCVVVEDPREQTLPAAGAVRLVDSEKPGQSICLRTSSTTVRARYAAAALARRNALSRWLHARGASVLFARSDSDPLRTLIHYFDERAAKGRGARS